MKTWPPSTVSVVARAIASSKLPVVSAIGHETDFTIADFVADLRAPTPSAAAELITEAQHKIAEHLATHKHRLDRAVRFQLLQARQRLTRLPVSRAETRVSALLHRSAQRLDDLSPSLDSASTKLFAFASPASPSSPPPSSATIRGRPSLKPANASSHAASTSTAPSSAASTPPPQA